MTKAKLHIVGDTFDAQYITPPFARKDDYIYWQPPPTDKEPSPKPVRICGWMSIEAKCSNEDGKKNQLRISFKDNNGVLRQSFINLGDIHKNNNPHFVELASAGLWITDKKLHKPALNTYINNMSARHFPRVLLVPTPGWHGTVYVLPDRTIGKYCSPDFDKIELAPNFSSAQKLSEKGDLDGWRNNIGVRCIGNPQLMFAVSGGFAGVLMGLLKMEGGGFHFYGPSSTGKSTALKLANSVWMEPVKLLSWNGTQNGIDANAALCNHRTLILDEIHQGGKNILDVIYSTANGRNRQRANKDGNKAEVGQADGWSTLILSSGEMTVKGIVAQLGLVQPAGTEVRLLDIKVQNAFLNWHGHPTAADFGKALEAAMVDYHGTAGPAFAQHCVNIWNELEIGIVTGLQKQLMKPFNGKEVDPQVERAALRFALVAQAGELATEFGITGWSIGDAMNAARICFEQWIDTRGTILKREDQHAIDTVRAFLNENQHWKFIDIRSTTEKVHHLGWKDDDAFYMDPEVFTQHICNKRGLDYNSTLATLDRYGHLDREQSRKTPLKRKSVNGVMQPLVCIKKSIFKAMFDDSSDSNDSAVTAENLDQP